MLPGGYSAVMQARDRGEFREEVVRFYKERPGQAQIGHRDLVLDTMDVDAVDIDDLVAFLQSLTGPLPAQELLHPPAASHQSPDPLEPR